MPLNIYLIGEAHIETLEVILLSQLLAEKRDNEFINETAGFINYIEDFYKQVNQLITGNNNLMLIEGYKIESFFKERGINKNKLRRYYWMDEPGYEDKTATQREEGWLKLIKNLASINIEGNMFVITGLYHLRAESQISKTNLKKELEDVIITEKIMNYDYRIKNKEAVTLACNK